MAHPFKRAPAGAAYAYTGEDGAGRPFRVYRSQFGGWQWRAVPESDLDSAPIWRDTLADLAGALAKLGAPAAPAAPPPGLAPERNRRGRTWQLEAMTAAQGAAYRRPGQPAPRYQATGALGSIIRAPTEEALRAKVRAADWE